MRSEGLEVGARSPRVGLASVIADGFPHSSAELPRVSQDTANTFQLLCLKEYKRKNEQGNGYLHTAAHQTPS